VDAEQVSIHARPEDQERLSLLIAEPSVLSRSAKVAQLSRSERRHCEFVSDLPLEHGVVLRTDRLYNPARLRKALRTGRDPESAVIWRLDEPHGLAGAEQELERRLSYQPLGHYWSLGPARAIARTLQPTRVRPNAVTLAAACLMLAAAGAVALAPWGLWARAAVAGALALALVLDTADGHLARLQGTASEFGRWLDGYLDELSDMALHAAIAWGAFVRDGQPGWLVLGMLYAMGKYQFVVATASTTVPEHIAFAPVTRSGLRLARSAVRLAGHADVRWHVWIVLAALGRLELALAAYAIYFPARALAVLLRKGVRRA
jgi:phosphatidylglycerophosphate synthase